MARPDVKRNIVKKRTKRFARFQSDRFMRVKASWRKPRGIDSAIRRKFKGNPLQPGCGYGSNKKTRNLTPSGFYKFEVKNVSDLDMLLMHSGKYAAMVASNVSAKSRKAIVARADELGVAVLNRKARLSTEESAQ